MCSSFPHSAQNLEASWLDRPSDRVLDSLNERTKTKHRFVRVIDGLEAEVIDGTLGTPFLLRVNANPAACDAFKGFICTRSPELGNIGLWNQLKELASHSVASEQ